MHSVTVAVDDTIYSNFKSFLELLPKDKARIIEDEIIDEPNSETIQAMTEIDRGEQLTTHASVDSMFESLSS